MSDIDKYQDIEEVAEKEAMRQGSMGYEIKAMDKEKTKPAKSKISPAERKRILKNLEKSAKGYAGAEKEGFIHTNKAKGFDDEGEKE